MDNDVTVGEALLVLTSHMDNNHNNNNNSNNNNNNNNNMTNVSLNWSNCSLSDQQQQQQLDDCQLQEHLSHPVPLHHQPVLLQVFGGLPQYYGPLYKTIGSFFVCIIFVVGLLGNAMVVYVVWRTRSMRTTTNCYLVSLAVADILLLVSAPLPTIVEYFLIIDQSLFGAGGCSVMVFSQYLGVNLSSLSITAFSVERYIAICHPMKARTLCTVSRAKRIIAGLWVFGVVYCGPWIALTTAKTKTFDDGSTIDTCDFKLERSYYLTYFMADLVIFYMAPLLLTCILYGLIARILYSSTSAMTSVNTATSSPCLPQSPRCCSASPNTDATNKKKRKKKKSGTQEDYNNGMTKTIVSADIVKRRATNSRIQVTKMLSVVVCVFAVLWLPYRAYVVYNSFASQRFENLWFLLFCRLMIYTNSAINPVLYNVMSVKFRRAFHRLLCCCPLHTDPRRQVAPPSTATATATVAATNTTTTSACAVYKKIFMTQVSRTTPASDTTATRTTTTTYTFEMN